MRGNRILIFDADTVEKNRLSASLNLEGYAVVLCSDVERTIALLRENTFAAALVFADPQNAGLELLSRLQAGPPAVTTPLLIATPADALETRLRGLDLGARDYLIRPFDTEQLLARITTTLYRQTNPPARARRRKISLDASGRIGDGAQSTWLTPTEQQAFALLSRHRPQPVSKDRLRAALNEGAGMTDNAIGVMIYRLRTKVRTVGMDIRVRRRVGYILDDHAPLPTAAR